MISFQKIAVVGVGLIGGSLAGALKSRGFTGRIVGFDRSDDNLTVALDQKLIDCVGRFPADIADVDLIVLAVPVGRIGSVLADIVDFFAPDCLIIDVGSTKTSVVADARAALGESIGRFIPLHPIAGREKSGAKAADADLFVDHRVVVTPLPENRIEDIEAICALWQFCGANLSTMTPEAHDRFFAAVSHLPHLLAYALVDDIAARAEADDYFEYAAGGFRDFTRIAASDPTMWADICLANRQAILDELTAFEAALARLRTAVEVGNRNELTRIFKSSREARTLWGERKQW